MNSELVDKSTQTENEETDLTSSIETIKPNKLLKIILLKLLLILLIILVKLKYNTIDNSSQTNTIDNSNITTTIDNEQYLSIESQRDQGYVKVDKDNSPIERLLPLFNEEYKTKYETI